MAPDAKLAFTDLGGGGSDGIFTPSDLSRSYYKYPYDVGARVHSDSWGSSSNDYEFMASEVDVFTWDHQVIHFTSFLFIVTSFLIYCLQSEQFFKIGIEMVLDDDLPYHFDILGHAPHVM